jgi:hypothetical protein
MPLNISARRSKQTLADQSVSVSPVRWTWLQTSELHDERRMEDPTVLVHHTPKEIDRLVNLKCLPSLKHASYLFITRAHQFSAAGCDDRVVFGGPQTAALRRNSGGRGGGQSNIVDAAGIQASAIIDRSLVCQLKRQAGVAS